VSGELSAALMVWAMAVPLWALFAVIWRGRWMRSWYRDGLFGPYAVSGLPGFAATLTVMGVAFLFGSAVLFFASAVPFIASIVLWFVVAWSDPVWAQPPWVRAERAAAGAGYDPQGALEASFRRPRRPVGANVAWFDAGAVLLSDDADRPVATTTRYGREGHLWVLPRRVEFLQSEGETAARGDVVDVRVEVEELVAVEVLRPEHSVRAWVRVLRGDSRGRVVRHRLRLTTEDASYTFHLRAPIAAAQAITAHDDAVR